LSITQALLKAIQTSYSKILKTSKDYVEQINKQLKEDGLGFADGYQGLLNLISWNKAGITFLGEGKNVQINDNTIAFISRAGDQETIESYHLSTKDSHEHNLKEGQELVHFSPDLKYAIVTHDYVSEIKNLENNKPVVKIRNKIKQSYFSPDLKHLVLNLYDHNKDIYSVMIIDLNNNSSHVIPGEMSLKKPIFNSNSKYLIGVNDKDDSLILLNLDNKTQIKTILLKDFTSDDLPLYSFSKDGTHLIVSNNKSKEVLLYNMDDISRPITLLRDSKTFEPIISPNNDYACTYSKKENAPVIINLKDKSVIAIKEKNLTPVACGDSFFIAINPESRYGDDLYAYDYQGNLLFKKEGEYKKVDIQNDTILTYNDNVNELILLNKNGELIYSLKGTFDNYFFSPNGLYVIAEKKDEGGDMKKIYVISKLSQAQLNDELEAIHITGFLE
jgi:WD40 repeat protein